jgi:hypothetical protein
MKCLLLLCALLFCAVVRLPGQAAPALPKGLFDFSDLDVKDKGKWGRGKWW